ncbi:adenylate cyclase type 3 [Stomoxys calcitrans]|uniref:adenylate cyclase type 3 n=1 Tax=Stomoxys calcitrans TaxID=35570 RepID=UPI0027E33899|nr:adenylate cyclase type 3 [Stomoxys calcitrans]XP_059220799.1 adenylate cyclase type 3 [Stomoxys calcitrans]XP_059220800.1 adenylate cyclase type 3 [Stomoxys calcitrans]XP_059220802.1 adenylate cyclase type 3 [Stomoxys calcitrans]XP_059220803.1 adenylate cyclase type 3 [Stomoxys calcitrans]XP_059220804.1 adenylate cyclase type 3 [Stomoxys calcitrans]XP_059220805.1 adenylate cyclase type 3 [Stomoxys calcitrans]XP_059220806.1 adenylate cyclase type 3 [Stomoxys calcitrans]
MTENKHQNCNNIENGHSITTIEKSRKDENESSEGPTVNLPHSVLNKLFTTFYVNQRREALKWFLAAYLCFSIYTIAIPADQTIQSRTCYITLDIIAVSSWLLMFAASKYERAKSKKPLHIALLIDSAPILIWVCFVLHSVVYCIAQQVTISARELLGWSILFNFLVPVSIPVPLYYTGCFMCFVTFFGYYALIYLTSRDDPMFNEMLMANMVLVSSALIIGLIYYDMNAAKQRRAFLEAKKSLEVKMIIEEESAEQERLLLSVLPKHVAEKMRQDLGSTSSEPFKKIYMSRHENVSILYADIVGFTAISSTYSAQDLVKMLNELFARFDRLAEKYQQLRIKILGDCYYCISGAPDERSDHAVLCVHMGLSMVKAIKYVQQKANSPVDMRVGIHTGAVLAGILGQRQWQFDVYSKDVELANKMESSGKAGRVHISDKTLAYLNGEFEVEPAYGEKREEALRIAGLKTYFIVKVLKPFASPSAKKINETQSNQGNNDNDDTLDEELLAETNDEDVATKEIDETEVSDKGALFKEQLRNVLRDRDYYAHLDQDTNFLLKFKVKESEDDYASYREPFSSLPLIAALIVQSVDIFYSFLILPRSPLHFVNIAAPLIPIFMLVFISVAESFPGHLPDFFVSISKRYNDFTLVRELTAVIIVLTLGLSNIIDEYFFVAYIKSEHIVSESVFNKTQSEEDFLVAEPMIDATPDPLDNIMYPSYLSNFSVLILIATTVVAQLTHYVKILLLTLITGLHWYFNVYVLCDLYSLEDDLAYNPIVSTSRLMSASLVLITISLAFWARHMDREDRVIFKWKLLVSEQKERADDMRQRNEALVYNVLPVHVAEHFMKNTKRSHDDLYSQSYSEVGVLFASMPNFSDFYSEESVNNQGLECLRFLNEVISDFDALLELPQFQDIIKIKTIGSTYMAASGINLNRDIKPGDPITKRWAHLDLLVEFALELKKTLQDINEQSFNHFVLKMGVNHGPITAGVIGARKPHYDIWGNTVNVASRMESTGKAGSIQVTEETCNILQEFGYSFLQRGLVTVKGKGELMTYYLRDDIPKQTVVANVGNPTDATAETEIHLKMDETEAADIKTPLLQLASDTKCQQQQQQQLKNISPAKVCGNGEMSTEEDSLINHTENL